jgi:hypothetical protein
MREMKGMKGTKAAAGCSVKFIMFGCNSSSTDQIVHLLNGVL